MFDLSPCLCIYAREYFLKSILWEWEMLRVCNDARKVKWKWKVDSKLIPDGRFFDVASLHINHDVSFVHGGRDSCRAYDFRFSVTLPSNWNGIGRVYNEHGPAWASGSRTGNSGFRGIRNSYSRAFSVSIPVLYQASIIVVLTCWLDKCFLFILVLRLWLAGILSRQEWKVFYI